MRRTTETPIGSRRLKDINPALESALSLGVGPEPQFDPLSIRRDTQWVTTRDGIRLATDVYLPPAIPGPVIAVRTPYGRTNPKVVMPLISFARHGYVAVIQDCRGTGDSEPDSWDYYVYESEDGVDCVEWISQQPWYGGFLGSCGSSYVAQTQWGMALHPRMSTIVPEVSGLGIAPRTVHLYMFLNAFTRTVGKGADKAPVSYEELERLLLEETLAGGYFNEPLQPSFAEPLLSEYPQLQSLTPVRARRWLWEHYCSLPPLQRCELIKRAVGGSNVTMSGIESLSRVFGQEISHDAHTIPHAQPIELVKSFHTPVLMITGWYDWGLDDTLATWSLLMQTASADVRARSRLLITPSAHNVAGYHEGMEAHPELKRNYRLPGNVALLLRWYSASRTDSVDDWPAIIYYLLGANEWRTASAWPPREARPLTLYLDAAGLLSRTVPRENSVADCYIYDPANPTPTLGGSILSYVYPPGSIDVSEILKRSDVLFYATPPLEKPLDVVGPLRVILFVSSSVVDTDFAARLSDVFPDGRAIQLQSGILRSRYRNPSGEPELLKPGLIYRLEIDMWATANRFARGHRLCLDISSADFPRFDRNTNRGGGAGPPITANQKIYHDTTHASQLQISTLGDAPWQMGA